jgi:hypothetical protein
MMDKSLGWLRSKSASKSLNVKSKSINFTSNVTQGEESYIHPSQNVFSQKSSIIITAPSMSSSFDMSKLAQSSASDECKKAALIAMNHCHSTPRSLLQQVSPIFSPHDYRKSQNAFGFEPSIASCTSSTSSLSIETTHRRRRLSFGATSSPRSSNSASQVGVSKNLTSTFYRIAVSETNSEEADYFVDSKLLNHIESVKQKSIKLENGGIHNKRVYSQLWSDEDCDAHYGMYEQNVVDSESKTTTKRRKLQQIFQIKLKNQLRELRKWHVGMRGDLDLNNEADEYKQAQRSERRRMHSSRIVQTPPTTHDFAHPNNCVCYQCFLAFRALMQNRNETNSEQSANNVYINQQISQQHCQNYYVPSKLVRQQACGGHACDCAVFNYNNHV